MTSPRARPAQPAPHEARPQKVATVVLLRDSSITFAAAADLSPESGRSQRALIFYVCKDRERHFKSSKRISHL